MEEGLKAAKHIKDFLASLDQFVMKDSTKKVTLALTEESLALFKKAGQKRLVLDEYSKHYKGSEQLDQSAQSGVSASGSKSSSR